MDKLIRTANQVPLQAQQGTLLAHFSPIALARAIEQETVRAQAQGWRKLTLNLDIADAIKLAQFLRGK